MLDMVYLSVMLLSAMVEIDFDEFSTWAVTYTSRPENCEECGVGFIKFRRPDTDPDFRNSGTPEFQIFGSSEFRTFGNPEFQNSQNPDSRNFADF